MNIEVPNATEAGPGNQPAIEAEPFAIPIPPIPRREIPGGTDPHSSLISVGWRAMRRGVQERDEQRRAAELERQRWADGMCSVALEWYRVERMLEDPRWSEGGAWLGEVRRALESAKTRWNGVASDLVITVVAPVGAEYVGDLVNYLGNAAQIPTPGLDRALVREVIAPAVLVGDKLQRTGEAIIAIPEEGASPADSAAVPSEMSAVAAILGRKRDL